MENKIKRIAVLTSGGDAPGMNAAVRAVVRILRARCAKLAERRRIAHPCGPRGRRDWHRADLGSLPEMTASVRRTGASLDERSP